MRHEGKTILTYEEYWQVCKRRRAEGKAEPTRVITGGCLHCKNGILCKDKTHLPYEKVTMSYPRPKREKVRHFTMSQVDAAAFMDEVGRLVAPLRAQGGA